MANSSTPSPAAAPAEAPEIKSIQELQQKKADILGYLQSVPGLSAEEKAKFAEEFEKDMMALDTKTEEEKKKDIGSLKAEIAKLQADIHGEKKDANEEVDPITGTDETTVEADQKLVEKEIRGRLDEFRASIDTKLAAPETPPTASPEPAEEVPPETQDAINSAKEFFSNKGVKLDTVGPVQWNFFKNFFNKILLSFYGLLEWFGIDVRNQKARIEGYKNYESKQIVDETFKVLSGYVGDSLWEIKDIPEREKLVNQIRDLGLPLVAGSNILAGPLMKVIFTGDESAWESLPNDFDKSMLAAVRGKYLAMKENPGVMNNMSTAEKLKELFTIEEDKKWYYTTLYNDDRAAREREEQVVPTETETTPNETTTETAPETTNSLDTIMSRYDGRPYEEEQEAASKDSIFTFEKDDIFLAIKRGDQKEIININADGKLNYRGITGTPEMIIQLARLDMYVNSLPGKLTLSDGENLSQNTIKKTYFDYAADVDSFSMNTMPEFLSGWDWQQLYNFLLRDGNRQIAPAEAAEMSGEKPQSVTQEDLDIIMDRTDVRETVEGAKFAGKIEEDKSITITRATEDGEKKWDETIFPNADGTYTIGNVRFPNITDAIKAANMRNWVRWHESEGHELHIEEGSIQVNDGVFNDTDLIKNWKIPEFLTHGVIPNTENALTNLSDVYDFLKGAVIDDGIYGKNKTRAQWQSEQITNT